MEQKSSFCIILVNRVRPKMQNIGQQELSKPWELVENRTICSLLDKLLETGREGYLGNLWGHVSGWLKAGAGGSWAGWHLSSGLTSGWVNLYYLLTISMSPISHLYNNSSFLLCLLWGLKWNDPCKMLAHYLVPSKCPTNNEYWYKGVFK